ncbi:MAG: GntR family transcriptional regulator [Planctomycetaceae bacterium]|nr:GntR family transcriptional regulator [Planctomycetaceae bacterium]
MSLSQEGATLLRPATEFILKEPLPKYRSTDALVKQLIDYITTGGFDVGSEFLSDKDLVTQTGRSRTAVRRALDVLQTEGWIRRQGGKGTYVGERLTEYRREFRDGTNGGTSGGVNGGASEVARDSEPARCGSQQSSSPRYGSQQSSSPRCGSQQSSSPRCGSQQSSSPWHFSDTRDLDGSRSLIRVAVAVSGLRNTRHEIGDSWYYGEILKGIDEMAATESVVMEFLGYHGTRTESLLRRLNSHRPDVFLCIGPPMNHASLIGLAGRWDIPCVMAATRAPELGLPNIYEDSVTAARDAVAHLVELGHRRIGFLQVMSPSGWWAFDRYEGYLKGMREFRLEQDNELGLWLPLQPSGETADMIRRYLKKQNVSALICGCFWAVGHLTDLIRKQEIRVPQDISCVVFDQEPVVPHLLGGVKPTTIQLPLKDIGVTFVKMVRLLVEHKEIPMTTALPCGFSPGESTVAYQPMRL